MNDSGARKDTKDVPGASRSAWRAAVPLLLNDATDGAVQPSARSRLSEAPTASTYGSIAGSVSRPADGPWLPAATTTTSPCRQAFSAAAANGSS